MRELLQTGRLSWIPPAHIQELRTLVRLRKTLLEERTAWQHRIQAQLFHHGQPAQPRLLRCDRETWLGGLLVSPAGRQVIDLALRMIDHLNEELDPIERQLLQLARRQAGCRALVQQHYGIGPFTAVAILSEHGDARRFSNSRQAVRHSGLDITVHQSDTKRARGRLSHQGPPLLRWALYEAAMCAARPTSPDLPYYLETSARIGKNRARLAVARKLLRRAHHTLRQLGDQALEAAS
jgi:transposase